MALNTTPRNNGPILFAEKIVESELNILKCTYVPSRAPFGSIVEGSPITMVWNANKSRESERLIQTKGDVYIHSQTQEIASHRLCLETILGLTSFSGYSSTSEWSNPLSAGQKSKTPPCGFALCQQHWSSVYEVHFPRNLGAPTMNSDERVGMITVRVTSYQSHHSLIKRWLELGNR